MLHYLSSVAQCNYVIKERFKEASALTGKEFSEQLDFYVESWLPARDLVKELVDHSKASFDSTGKVLLFEKFVPWKVRESPFP